MKTYLFRPHMKNGQRILLLIGCFWALLGSAQKNTDHHLWVNVIDAFTGQALSLDRNVKVDLLQLDSTVVSSAVCRERRDQGSGERQMIVTFSVPLQKDPVSFSALQPQAMPRNMSLSRFSGTRDLRSPRRTFLFAAPPHPIRPTSWAKPR